MIRVLQVFGRLDRGGAETMLMNLYRNIDRERVQFDFVIHTEEECDFSEEVRRLGGRIFSAPRYSPSTAPGYRRFWREFFKAHPEYHVVHAHMRSTASIFLSEAKRQGRITIAHSHNTSSGRGFSALVKNLLQYPLRYIPDWKFSCSQKAGEWLYGKKAVKQPDFVLLKNGIDTEKFHFSQDIRDSKRRELLGERKENASVFIHIGRFEPQKNHHFLMEIFSEILKLSPEAELFLCGEGPLREQVDAEISALGLNESVHCLGLRKDIPELLMAADALVFPSLFEGLPVTVVEAQAAGLPVLYSDTVTAEVSVTDLAEAKSLPDGPKSWAQEALGLCGRQKESREKKENYTTREEYSGLMAEAGYDVKDSARWLQEFYEAQ